MAAKSNSKPKQGAKPKSKSSAKPKSKTSSKPKQAKRQSTPKQRQATTSKLAEQREDSQKEEVAVAPEAQPLPDEPQQLPEPEEQQPAQPEPQTTPAKKSSKRLAAIVVSVVALLVIAGALSWYFLKPNPSPVPTSIRRSVGFAVYYPDQKRLPSGYSLDPASFTLAQPGVVVYSVTAGTKRLVISEEQAPDASIIDKFTSTYIPLHTEVATPYGKGQMGAAGQGANLQTVVSLPISKGPWLIMTAPAAVKQADIQAILQDLVR